MRKIVFAAALSAFATPAHVHAQPVLQIPAQVDRPSHSPGDAAPRRPRRHLFISPSGEPFRGPNGFRSWFDQADADHDGAITLAEFQADAERAFRQWDANSDGVIDGFELQAYERDVVPEITEYAVGGPMPGPGGGPRGGWGRGAGHHRGGAQSPEAQQGDGGDQVKGAGVTGAARFSLLNEPEPLTAADLNVDGKVTHAEWTAATARRFARLDKANTGKLTPATLQPPKEKR